MNSLTERKSDSNMLMKNVLKASMIVNKNYLSNLSKMNISEMPSGVSSIDIISCSSFYKLTKLVVNKNENFLNKLVTVVNVASSISASICTIIESNGDGVDFYIGIVSKNEKNNDDANRIKRKANDESFRGAIEGNFIGSDIEFVENEELKKIKNEVLGNKSKYYSSISGIASLRSTNREDVTNYVQGIENLVDSLRGKKYTIVMVADPVSSSELSNIKNGYEILYSQLSHMGEMDVTMSENETRTLSESSSETISKSISEGISMTQGSSVSTSSSASVNSNGGFSFIVNAGCGKSKSSSIGSAMSRSYAINSSESSQKGSSRTSSSSDAETKGKSIQLKYKDRRIKSLLDKIDKNLERLDECDNYGAFNSATYVISDDYETNIAVSSNYNALMLGENTGVQSFAVNTWKEEESRETISEYMEKLSHPKFYEESDKNIKMSPASIVTGNELAVQIGLPKKSISGLTVVPIAPFGRNIVKSDEREIKIGKLYHMGTEDMKGRKDVNLDIESLSMHTFITGSTGSGKSTVMYSILEKLMKTKVKGSEDNNIKFMVIEPAKGEYKNHFSEYDDVKVFGTNYMKTPLLKINPFSFPEDIHVLEHIDRLIEIFNVCWPMYAAMPAVLKDSVERAYRLCGWNLRTSECKYKSSNGKRIFPTFKDVLSSVIYVIEESHYSDESKGNYQGALCTRLRSLTNGIFGEIFSCNEIDAEDLFDSNVIVDLSRVASVETKSLLMGILIMKLQEHRMSYSNGDNENLKHVTVLEEAHNILKRTSIEQTTEGANMLGKSVEMLSNSIAEMRTYGEGFFIVDQAPGLMDMSVIRNTNTKIILRLPDESDRELVGRASSLTDDQIKEISRLKTLVAAVYQNNWLEPVLCKVDYDFREISKYKAERTELNKESLNEYIEFLFIPYFRKNRNYSEEELQKKGDGILDEDISAESKVNYLRYLKAVDQKEIQRIREKICRDIFNFEEVYRFDSDLDNWVDEMINNIEPSIEEFDEKTRNKILVTMLREKLKRAGSDQEIELLNNLMERI